MALPSRAASALEWELDANMTRTGRWRRRQYYGLPPDAHGNLDKRIPADRKACEWREGVPR